MHHINFYIYLLIKSYSLCCRSSRGNGYLPSVGSVDARRAIAQYTNQQSHSFHHFLACNQPSRARGPSFSLNSSSSSSGNGASGNNVNGTLGSNANISPNGSNGEQSSPDIETVWEAVTATLNSSSRKVTEEDVIIASGCSGAVELAISVLLNPGDNLLVPWCVYLYD